LIKCYLLLWSTHQELLTLPGVLSSLFKTSVELRLENLAFAAPTRRAASVGAEAGEADLADRILWVLLRRVWSDWKSAPLIVKPETVIARDFVSIGLGKFGAGSRGAQPCRRRFVI
jgi:hypothetical protein